LTKKALAASLKALMLSVPLAKVTVATIVDHCGLNRQTFYYHFPDKYHLVNWIYDQEALALIDDCRSYRTWTEGILRVFTTLHQDRAFYVNALNDPGPNAFDDYLFRSTQGFVKAVVDEVVAVVRASEAVKTFGQELAAKEGLLAGISSGANVLAARKLAARPENAGKPIVTIVCDTGERYISTLLFHHD